MGEVKINIELQNFSDVYLHQEGKLLKEKIRCYHTNAVVDTGAVMLAIPQDIVEKLGLQISGSVIVKYADERKEERKVASGLFLSILDRTMVSDCIVLPPASEILIGQLVLERLDFIVDCQKQSLSPRPESPIYPMLNLK